MIVAITQASTLQVFGLRTVGTWGLKDSISGGGGGGMRGLGALGCGDLGRSSGSDFWIPR